MTERSEHNLTEIMERIAVKAHEQQIAWALAEDKPVPPAWDDLSMDHRRKLKDALLPTVMLVLDIADDVDSTTRPTEGQFRRIVDAVQEQINEDLATVGEPTETTDSLINVILAVNPALISREGA